MGFQLRWSQSCLWLVTWSWLGLSFTNIPVVNCLILYFLAKKNSLWLLFCSNFLSISLKGKQKIIFFTQVLQTVYQQQSIYSRSELNFKHVFVAFSFLAIKTYKLAPKFSNSQTLWEPELSLPAGLNHLTNELPHSCTQLQLSFSGIKTKSFCFSDFKLKCTLHMQ